MTTNCAICQDSGIELKNIYKAQIGTPLVQIKELLLQVFEEEHMLPNGIGQYGERESLICTRCEIKLLEYYEATLLVTEKRKRFELLVKPPNFIDTKSLVQGMCTDSFNTGLIPINDVKCDFSETAMDADDIDLGRGIKIREKHLKQQSHNNENLESSKNIKNSLQSAKALKYCLEFFVECLNDKLELQIADAAKKHNTIFESRCSPKSAGLPSEYTEKSVGDSDNYEDLTKEYEYEHHRENHKENNKSEQKIAAKYDCLICDRSFAKRSLFSAHKDRHSALTCSHCNMSFMYKCDMKQHMEAQHPDIKEYLCDECGNQYINSKCLYKHKILHKEPRDFPCVECPRRFNQISSLKRHKLTHSGLKPHVCPVCFRRFAMKYNMRLHMKAHAKQGNFKKRPECITCGQFFTAQQLLDNHLAAGSCRIFESSF